MMLAYEKGGAFVTLEFDATLRLVELGTAQAAQHPVSEGIERTTSSRPQAVRLSAEVLITDTPLADEIGGLVATRAPLALDVGTRTMIAPARVAGGPRTLPLPGPTITIPGTVQVTEAQIVDAPGVVTVQAHQYLGEVERVATTLRELDRLRRESVRVAVLAKWGDYPDMLITSISTTTTPADAVIVQLELVEVLTGTTESVVIQLAAAKPKPKPKEKRAEAAKDAGQQGGYALEPAEDSVAKGLQNKLNTKLAALNGVSLATVTP